MLHEIMDFSVLGTILRITMLTLLGHVHSTFWSVQIIDLPVLNNIELNFSPVLIDIQEFTKKSNISNNINTKIIIVVIIIVLK